MFRFNVLLLVSSVFLNHSASLSNLDSFGIKKIFATDNTVEDAEFYDNFAYADRSITAVSQDPYSDHCWARGSGTFVINSTNGAISLSGSSPRYYCYLNTTNVELTTYGSRGSETSTLSTQGLVIVGRSDHKDYSLNYCSAQSYYMRLYNNGKLCFLKEFIHNSGGDLYGGTAECLIYGYNNPCITVFDTEIDVNYWYGMKFIIQNIYDSENDDTYVNLLGYLDITSGGLYHNMFENINNASNNDGNGYNGGNWTLYLNYTDYGDNWYAYYYGNETKCMQECDYTDTINWVDETNSIFLRASYIDNYRYKWFSKREIIPMTLNSETSNNNNNTNNNENTNTNTNTNTNSNTNSDSEYNDTNTNSHTNDDSGNSGIRHDYNTNNFVILVTIITLIMMIQNN